MVKRIALVVAMMISGQVFASQQNVELNRVLVGVEQSLSTQAATLGLNWHVGDNCHYNMNMGPISGKMDVLVRETTAEGYYWLVQDMDLSVVGKQKMELLIDPATGQIKKLLVNGKEQEPPTGNGDMEVIENRADQVTVPAGTFKAVYIKVKNKKDNKITEQWVNPKDIPVMGLLKSIGEADFGQVVLELTSFERK